jgi:anti-sigma factor RsiW
MSAHVLDKLPLAAAALLDPTEAAAVEAHVRECPACAAEAASWRGLAGDLRRLSSPSPSPALVARTRAAVESRLAERAEHAWNRAALAFVVGFAWTLAVGAWLLLDLVRGELTLRLGASLGPTAAWYAAYTFSGWVAAAAAAVLLGRRASEEKRRFA